MGQYTTTRSSLILLLLLLLTVLRVAVYGSNEVSVRGSGAAAAELEFVYPFGDIHEDVACNVEQLDYVNDSQLYTILSELRNTTFFKMYMVDLDHGCPLQGFNKKKKQTASTSTNKSGPSSSSAFKTSSTKSKSLSSGLPGFLSEKEEPVKCASEGIPDLDPAMSACGVQVEDSTPKFSLPPREAPRLVTKTIPITSTESNEEEDEENFECTGGKNELDEDAPPLCTVSTDSHSGDPFFSSALDNLSKASEWKSESQKETFTWSKPSDPVIEDKDARSCDNGIPDDFWQDICTELNDDADLQVVNLALNPERNTGYNGTHIWDAMYEENCLAIDGDTNAPMCFEEKVLYRLLSGLHSSTTLSIAKNYYPPSKRKGRVEWEPNPQYFMEKFSGRPQYIRNLHFSYLVLLRALQKATPYLIDYAIVSGDPIDDMKASLMMRRLVETPIMQSCSQVFSAFDESLMFQANTTDIHGHSLQHGFKDVFRNVTSILDCVQCQQCKLHAKVAMHGYGTALKILFSPDELIPTFLSRNDVVAFINTVAKLSEALKEVRELAELYYHDSQKFMGELQLDLAPGTKGISTASSEEKHDLVDRAISLISSLAAKGDFSPEREAELVSLAFSRDPDVMILAKHYGDSLQKFAEFSKNIGQGNIAEDEPDAIVVGSGLAGLAAALRILDRGGKVLLIEKEHRIGGNSAKASSGINACCPHEDEYGDSLGSFKNDTVKSAGSAAQIPLIDTLVDNSAEAVQFLTERAGVDLSLLAQLGGHSHKRTHRPNNGMAGAEIIYAMQKAVKKFEATGMVQILMDTKVTNLIKENGAVVGVEYEILSENGSKSTAKSPNVILATGGFASDRSSGSYLEKYRPELMKMPATAGGFSTGDGVSLAVKLGAGTIDMDKVQLHPTGWVDLSDPENPTKILAAELMRGVGGILINSEGRRFCNEVGTRAYVTDRMLGHDNDYAATGKWNSEKVVPIFNLVLSSSAAEDGRKHVDLYTHKGLLTPLKGTRELADWMGVDVTTVRSTLQKYREDSSNGVDEWGKTTFRGLPSDTYETETFYAGKVTPVLHYCMGGITIDTEGNVLDEDKKIIKGLHAAGEVSGGVHGNNRLGGNSLLECTVYGSIVGKKIPIKQRKSKVIEAAKSTKTETNMKEVTMDELAKHNTPDDCWISLHGVVYDFTDFAEEHPPGAESIYKLGGTDGTEAFKAVHSIGILDDFIEDKVGILIR